MYMMKKRGLIKLLIGVGLVGFSLGGLTVLAFLGSL